MGITGLKVHTNYLTLCVAHVDNVIISHAAHHDPSKSLQYLFYVIAEKAATWLAIISPGSLMATRADCVESQGEDLSVLLACLPRCVMTEIKSPATPIPESASSSVSEVYHLLYKVDLHYPTGGQYAAKLTA